MKLHVYCYVADKVMFEYLHLLCVSCRLLSSAVGFKAKYLSWQTWQKWCIDMFGKVHSMRQKGSGLTGAEQPTPGQTSQGESPATEVLKFRDPKGYFGGKSTHVVSLPIVQGNAQCVCF